MVTKRILIVSGAFFPENSPRSFRTTELAKEFIRQGHQVTICVNEFEGRQHFFDRNKCEWLNLGPRKWKPISKTSKYRIFQLLINVLRRLLSLFFEYPDIELLFQVRKTLKNKNDYDLLISIAVPYPIHWGVAFSWNSKKPIAKNWIADCGDPYMGDIMDTFRKPFYFKYLEKYFFRKCNYVSVPFEGAKEGYYKEFHNKIRVIPQGFNFKEIKSNMLPYVKNGIPTFCYAGTIFKGGRDPNKFINYLNTLDLDFVFYIYTNNPNLIIDSVGQSKGRILVYELIDKVELIGVQSKMDFNINFKNTSEIQLPSKLIELSIINRPILNIDCNNINQQLVLDFLTYGFNDGFVIKDLNSYEIHSVTEKFTRY